jgi:hypothetical protein
VSILMCKPKEKSPTIAGLHLRGVGRESMLKHQAGGNGGPGSGWMRPVVDGLYLRRRGKAGRR